MTVLSSKVKYKKVRPYEKLSVYYDEIIGPDYNEFFEFFLKLKKKFQLDFASVLDIGCGNGTLTQLLQSKTQGDFLGIDLSADMIRSCNEHYPAIQFLKKNILFFYPPNQFSFIYFLNSGVNYFLSFGKFKKLINKVYKILKNGGNFFFDMSSEKNYLENYANVVDSDIVGNMEYLIESTYNSDTGRGDVLFRFRESSEQKEEFFLEKHKICIFNFSQVLDFLQSLFETVEIFYDFGESETEKMAYNFSFLCRKAM